MKSFWEKEKGFFSAVLIIAIVYGIFFLTGIGCPIKFVTGISCAGCGMTRAWWCLLHGNVNGAIYYHPLFFLVPPAFVWYFLREKLPRKVYCGGIALVIIAFLAVYFIRMMNPTDTVVIFKPETGIVFRLFKR